MILSYTRTVSIVDTRWILKLKELSVNTREERAIIKLELHSFDLNCFDFNWLIIFNVKFLVSYKIRSLQKYNTPMSINTIDFLDNKLPEMRY